MEREWGRGEREKVGEGEREEMEREWGGEERD